MSDNDSDEWGQEELVIPPAAAAGAAASASDAAAAAASDEDYWKVAPPQQLSATKTSNPPPKKSVDEDSNKGNDQPLLLVDVTHLDDAVHCRFDAHSVNDAAAASAWRRKLEANYDEYARNTDLLAAGTVVPCGAGVWRAALQQLRSERVGHYWCPVFPPKTKHQK